MARPGQPRRPPTLRAELAVVIGVFALLLQALLPGLAVAADARDPAALVVVCSATGPHLGAADATHGDAKGKGPARLPCHDCLTCAMATVPQPAPAGLSERPELRAVSVAGAPERAVKLARAPPRPPGQGPPTA